MYRITIIGNDSRLTYAAAQYAERGDFVSHYIPANPEEFPELEPCDLILLPIPMEATSGNIKGTGVTFSDISSQLCKAKHVALGKATEEFISFARSTKLSYTDINDNPLFKTLNAIPTAEAAIQIAMQQLSSTLYNTNVLICGFGCIGKQLIRVLNGFGANITLAARKPEDIALAETAGCKAIPINMLRENVAGQKIIFNTCPAPVLTSAVIASMDSDAIIIDLASRPGGTDFSFAGLCGIKAGLYLSLPSEYAPESASKTFLDTIDSILVKYA